VTALVDEIVAGLAAGGEVVDSGAFTIDRAHALRKLEQYQLREPALAAARFVEAAGLLGGSVRVVASPWGLQFLLHRVYLSRAEAQDLLLYAVERGRSPRSRAIGELAVGMLAADRNARRFPTLTSTDTEGPYRVTHEADHTPVLVPLDDVWRPTSIEIVRFLLPLPLHYRDPGDLPELELLRVLTLWSTTNVFVDDVQVSLGLPRHLLVPRALSEPGVRGVVGLRGPYLRAGAPAFARYALGHRSTLHLLSNGIHIQALELPAVPSAVCAVLDLADLRKDVAHEHVVRDASFEAQLEWLRERFVEYGAWLDEQFASDDTAAPRGYSPARIRDIGSALKRLRRLSI
jgi:hypothetical protein